MSGVIELAPHCSYDGGYNVEILNEYGNDIEVDSFLYMQ